MLRDTAILVSPILALLLVVLTPIGTGQGAHRDQFVDPLFPHIHLGASSFPTTTARGYTSLVSDREQGPVLGAGAGVASGLAFGPTPTVPRGGVANFIRELSPRIAPRYVWPGGAPPEAPPEPPPTTA